MLLKANQKILFIGDSITEGGRTSTAPLGSGYVNMIYDLVTARYPELNITFINKGIGGNTVRDLDARWEQDAIAPQPDWLSVMIGVNDVWAMFGNVGVKAVPLAEYQATLRRLLQRVKAATKAQIILAEPFMIEPDHSNPMRQMLDVYRQTLDGLAPEFNAMVVHTQGVWDDVMTRSTPSFWSPDKVHPNSPGHALIAMDFLRLFQYAL